VLSQRGSSSGRFTFTAHEAGDHKICFTASSNSGNPGWLSTNNHNGGIKLILDLVIGESNQIESTDKTRLQDLASRVKDLNIRLSEIRKEQVFQRVSLFSPRANVSRSVSAGGVWRDHLGDMATRQAKTKLLI
jgi:hypothetical protein